MAKPKKASLLQRICLGGALAASSLGLISGCEDPSYYSQTSYPTQSNESESWGPWGAGGYLLGLSGNNQSSQQRIVLTYNSWIDNGDGLMDPTGRTDRFEGLGKKYFHPNEEIGVTKIITNQKGRRELMKVTDSNGNIIYQAGGIISSNNYHSTLKTASNRLIHEMGGPGEVTIRWSIDGQEIDLEKILVMNN
ncbi:MAG: hypothetical protein WC438_00870 [Candidatus Pacearchaeota archaeon]